MPALRRPNHGCWARWPMAHRHGDAGILRRGGLLRLCRHVWSCCACRPTNRGPVRSCTLQGLAAGLDAGLRPCLQPPGSVKHPRRHQADGLGQGSNAAIQCRSKQHPGNPKILVHDGRGGGEEGPAVPAHAWGNPCPPLATKCVRLPDPSQQQSKLGAGPWPQIEITGAGCSRPLDRRGHDTTRRHEHILSR